MISKIFKRVFSLLGMAVSLTFIFLSLHSYFVLEKADFYFMISAFLFSLVCLIIFTVLFFDKVQFIDNKLNIQKPSSNILFGICCIVMSTVFIFSLKTPLLRDNYLLNIVGIGFLSFGGLALLFKGIRQHKRQ